MPLVRALCVWPWTTGRPEDVSSNTFHFNVTGTLLTEVTNIFTALNSFYGSAYGNDQRSPLIDHDAGFVRFYDMSEAEPRVPIDEFAFTALSGTAGTTALPPEAAMVVSVRAEIESGDNKRRRMGRTYLGPFSTQALSSGTGRPGSGFISNLVTAANNLLIASNTADPDWVWAIYSPTDGVARQVVEGYVNNEFDTQRRRGLVDTSRSAFDGT